MRVARSVEVALTVFMLTFAAAVGATIPQSERNALIALYDSTEGPNWANSDGWLDPVGTECTWYGVTCDDAGARVTALGLSENQLSGPIPPEIGGLTRLVELDLGYNDLQGEIPLVLTELRWLEVLDLYSNALSGEIPTEIGGMGSLRWLWLGRNQLEGSIPESLGNLENLELLLLRNNRLTGVIPSSLGNLENLENLQLSYNQLTGEIPTSLTNLRNLTVLGLQWNRLTGSIPDDIGNLTALQNLMLNENELTGPIPESIGQLSEISMLWLYRNQLEGTIPPELGNLDRLYRCLLSDNQLEGTIPPELGNLESLGELALGQNNLTGSIPPELASLRQLEGLSLDENQLTGEIPAFLGDFTELEILTLARNQFEGEIPPELGNLHSLRYLHLDGNQLTGPIPQWLGDLGSLYSLYLDHNRLTGPIPPGLGNLGSLRYLYLEENRLTGPIPPEFSGLSSLEYFFVNGNAITGPLPDSLKDLTKLINRYGLDLRWNGVWTDDPDLRDFLSPKQRGGGDWESTQTVPPDEVEVSAIDETSVAIEWQRIPYSFDPGFYRVSMSTAAAGPYETAGDTSNKRQSSLTVTGLDPGTTYYFRVQTVTRPHLWNDNTVLSEPSDWVTATTPARPVCTISCDASGPASAAAGGALGFSSDITIGECDLEPAVLWDFGDGETSAAPNPSHAYVFPGSYEWTMTASAGGATCTGGGTTVVSSADSECGNDVCEVGETAWSCTADCGLEDGQTGRCGESASDVAVPAAVGGTGGVADTYWVSEAMIFNPGSDGTSFNVRFTPDQQPGSPKFAGPFDLAAGEALFWPNFIGELFDDSRNGSVVVAADRPVMLTTRTFNDQPGGTYGQYLGAVRTSRAFGPGDTGYLIGLSETVDSRTNVAFQEVSGRRAEVVVSTYGGDGTLLGSSSVTVPAGAKVQRRLPGMGIATVSNGYARFEVSGGQVVAVGSVADNSTGDAVTLDALHPMQLVGDSPEPAAKSRPKVTDIDFTWSPEYPEAGQQVQFTDTSSGGSSSWSWDFGDGSTSDQQHPVHTFSGAGTYTVVLTAVSGGTPGLRIRTITVIEPAAATEHFLIAVVAHLPGALGTQWRTDLVLMNPFDDPQQVRLEYLPVNDPDPMTRQLEVESGEQMTIGDVVETLFSTAGGGKGSLHLYATDGVFANSRTYNLGPDGTYGQSVPALGGGDLIADGEQGWLLKLKHSDVMRCNLGLTSFDDLDTRVRVRLYGRTDGELELLGTRNYDVDARQHRQIDGFIASMGVTESVDTLLASVEVTSGGRVYAYASNVDNRTGDGEFIPAIAE